MLNTDLRITPVDSSKSRVSWTTPWPDGASWLFVNGIRVAGPFVNGSADRSLRFPLDSSSSAAVEVHDFEEADALADPIEIEPNTRPLIIWRDVADAVRFRIYHRDVGIVTESLIYDKPRRAGQAKHRIICPVQLSGLGGRWHLFRVEAVDENGNESTRESWAYFVTHPADLPDVTVEQGSGAGLYDVTVA